MAMQQAVIGMAMMGFFSMKMNIHVPLVLQAAMGPFTIWESPLIRKHVFGKTENVWKETLIGDDDEDDDAAADGTAPATDATATDEDAAAVSAGAGSGGSAAAATGVDAELQDLMFTVWEKHQPFDLVALKKLMARGASVNFAAPGCGWTPLMVAAGSGKTDGGDTLALLELNANPTQADDDGWTAFSWAAFHGAAASMQVLVDHSGPAAAAAALTREAKDGKAPVQLAEDQSNAEVLAIIHAAIAAAGRGGDDAEASGDPMPVPASDADAAEYPAPAPPSGLRQRKPAADAPGAAGIEELD